MCSILRLWGYLDLQIKLSTERLLISPTSFILGHIFTRIPFQCVRNTLCMKVSSYYSHDIDLYTSARSNLVNPPYSFLFRPMTAGKYWCTCNIINSQKITLQNIRSLGKMAVFSFYRKVSNSSQNTQKLFQIFHDNLLTEDYSGRN